MSQLAKDNNTMSASWQLYDAERMANESLRQQLAESEAERLEQARLLGMSGEREAGLLAEIERLKGMVDEIQAARHVQREHNRMLTNLAAAQAREQLLRDGLSWISRVNALDYEYVEMAKKTLANVSQDTSALDNLKAEVAARAGEVMRERCIGTGRSNGLHIEGSKKIRSIPGVTLEDLK